MIRLISGLMVGLGLFLVSCSQATMQATPTVQPTRQLTPFLTSTPAQTPVQPSATVAVTIPVTPTPTATPFVYTVKGDDTMLSIAYRFGITLEALQEANPTVDPHYMGQGLQLIIPIGEETPQSLPTPTMLPLEVGEPACYRTGDGGVWCISAVQNGLKTNVENLSVWIGLFDQQGNNFTSQTAYAPLNILRTGEVMPVMAYFAPPLPDQFQAHAVLSGALGVSPDDIRYVNVGINIDSTELSQDGAQATLKGEVSLPEGSPRLSQLWVLAVAYDSKGNIIGVRKWKSDGELSFEIPVYSLSGAIDHVETLVEARP
jgi:LysM repeat protein